jgi:uncharacterized membrane protein
MTPTIESDIPAPDPLRIPCASAIGVWFSVAAVLAFASSLLMRFLTLPVPLKYLVAALPIPALVILIFVIRRSNAALDEMHRRIQLEAFATAFGIATIAFLVFGQLQVADVLGPEDWIFPWLAIYFGYLYGLISARKRFQ